VAFEDMANNVGKAKISRITMQLSVKSWEIRGGKVNNRQVWPVRRHCCSVLEKLKLC